MLIISKYYCIITIYTERTFCAPVERMIRLHIDHLRSIVVELVEKETDADLLDLIFKLLLGES